MSARLAGKAALVTGGAGGLGAAIARALAAEGARVLVTDLNGEGAAAVAAGIDGAVACRHDVTDEADWQAALAYAQDAFGGLSVLVNNAGIAVAGTVEDLSLADWRRSMAVNADSAFLGCKHALPLLRAAQPASIVNISSIAAMIAGHNLAAYNASKAALWMLTKSVALQCARAKADVRCNSVHPTFVRTAILDDIIGDRDEATTLARLAKQIPNGRLGVPEDVAAAVVYLASDESRMMTGAELKLDGGMSAM